MSSIPISVTTLDSGINVGPRFIFFSWPYGLIEFSIANHFFCLPNFPDPMFIFCPMYIPESRVINKQLGFKFLLQNLLPLAA